jgi:hypothetical protein
MLQGMDERIELLRGLSFERKQISIYTSSDCLNFYEASPIDCLLLQIAGVECRGRR